MNDQLFLIPAEEHPFDVAGIQEQRLIIRLRLDLHSDLGIDEGFYLEFNSEGEMNRVIVTFDLEDGSQHHRPPETDEAFPIYDVNEARKLFEKYYPHLLAAAF